LELTAASRRWLIAGGSLLALLLVIFAGRALRRDRVAGHAFDIPTADGRIVVEVLNGSGKTGLGRLGTRRLRRMGLDVVYFGTAGAIDSTQVIARRGDRGRAEKVRDALGAGKVMVLPDTLRRVDVSVILGQDFQPDEDGRP
jgi:hypothetical protein